MSEVSLYPAIKRFLEQQGYEPKGEIAGCDVVGVRPGVPARLVVAELKQTFNLDLVLQGIERMAGADEVWLAVRATRRGRDRDARARKLCRLLGLGLLAVHGGDHIEVLATPSPYQPRKAPRRRRVLLAEHAARRGDPSPGGTRGVPIMTAYRQEALLCATMLEAGPRRPRDLRVAAPRAAAILHRNVYGWFERTARGVYAITDCGRAALARWPQAGEIAPADEP